MNGFVNSAAVKVCWCDRYGLRL